MNTILLIIFCFFLHMNVAEAQEEVFRYILEDYEQGTEQRDDVLVVGVKV